MHISAQTKQEVKALVCGPKSGWSGGRNLGKRLGKKDLSQGGYRDPGDLSAEGPLCREKNHPEG